MVNFMERMKKVEIKSPEEMIELGEKIGKYLEKNMVILMEGDLGAGKTTMTKGIAKALGISTSALSMYECGNRIPRDEIKVKMSKLYGKSIEEIFFTN